MPSTEYMRNELIRAYQGRKGWARKVRRMPDKQVFAIYTKMTQEKEKKTEPPKNDVPF